MSSSKPGKGRDDRFDRRSARNRKIVLAMAILMGLSLLAVPVSLLISDGRSTPAAEVEDDPLAAPEEPVEPEDRVGPCGETPDDVPEVTSSIYDEPFAMTIDEGAEHELTLETTCGDIVIDLDTPGAPIAVNNLVNLAEDGYYDGVIFHRVSDSPPVIQGGDPAGTGCGREDCSAQAASESADEPAFPGYTIEDELDTAEEMAERMADELAEEVLPELRAELDELIEQGIDPEALGLPAEPTDDDLRALIPGGYERGVVAMANAGPNSSGSQFFILHDDAALPPDYTIVGRVVDGMDVVDDIAASPTQVTEDARERPFEPVTIRAARVSVR